LRFAKFIFALILLCIGSIVILLAPAHVVDIMSEGDPELTAAMTKQLLLVVPVALAVVIVSVWIIRGLIRALERRNSS
jgi:Na+-driven multidrug efflux pump